MRNSRSWLLLGAILLVPACGGGGGGGGGGNPLVAPPDPAPLSPLSLVDTSSPDHVILTASISPTPLQQLQTALNAGGKITFDNGGSPFSLSITTTLTMPPAGVTAVIDGGANLNVSLTGTSDQIMIDKGGASNLTVQRLTFSGASNTGVKEVNKGDGAAIFGHGGTGDSGTMTAINCTFTNCVAGSSGPDIGGGAIRMINHSHVQVSGCTFTGCQGSNGGAIDSLGCELEVIASTFTNCMATGTGGGTDQGASGQGGIGGAIYVDGVHQFGLSPKLNVSSCTFTTNSANDHAGAIFAFTYEGTGSQCVFDSCFFDTNQVLLGTAIGKGGAIYHQDCGMALHRSTFKGNSTIKQGGALWSQCDVGVIEDCTFQGNQATGASALGGALNISGSFTLNALTISGNTAGLFSGGIWTGSASTITIMNSILDRNTGTDAFTGWNTNATLVDGGNNIQFLATAHKDPPLTATAIPKDPMLNPLANNGGPGPTMVPMAGSPALGTGNPATAPPKDEAGVAWVGSPNIGSY